MIINRNKNKGQTLVEVMLSFLFIAMSVIALIRFQSYLSYGSIVNQQKNFATSLAMSQIETLRDFQVLNDTSGYTSYQSISSGSSVKAGSTASYTTTWTVSAFTNPTYKNINVTVSWTDNRGGPQSVILSTNIAGIEPQNSSAIMGS